jgi:hypothetical protein
MDSCREGQATAGGPNPACIPSRLMRPEYTRALTISSTEDPCDQMFTLMVTTTEMR